MRNLFLNLMIVFLSFNLFSSAYAIQKRTVPEQKSTISNIKPSESAVKPVESIYSFCCLVVLEFEVQNCPCEDKLKNINRMYIEGPIKVKVRNKANFSNKTNPTLGFILTVKYWDMKNGENFTTFDREFPPIPEGDHTVYINLPEPLLTKRNPGVIVCIKPKPPYFIDEKYPQTSCKQNDWCTCPY